MDTDEMTRAAPRLAYRFARRAGAVLTGGAEAPLCLFRPPLAPDLVAEITRLAGQATRFEAVDAPRFDEALAAAYKSGSGEAAEAAETAGRDLASLADSAAAVEDLLDQSDDAPVVRLINAILLEAIEAGASDIHLEVLEHRLRVRLRVDGALRDILEPARSLAPVLVSRIKVMAQLDISERRKPQDGRVSLRVGGHDLDVRVSTAPAQHGERVVLRLLDRNAVRLDTARLGLGEADRARFDRLLARPDGVILVTGPTGSRKTTTLYTAMNALNTAARNIMTIEDPIEYALDGVGQMQVNTRTGFDFAAGLRTILRQDPDVVMVGEIRDRDTAATAVQAAMTGHMVLATLHTNTAAGAVTRLLDLGVERFLLAPVLRGVIAQRLVRRLCEACRVEAPANRVDVERLGELIAPGEPVWRPAGCEHCAGEGYRGRIGLYHVLALDAAGERLIHDGASEAELEALSGGDAMLDDGAAKVRAGLTSVEEVARVVHAQ
ncbi:MAG: ATPase, T2SS/T4P/T4SS family [Oceanicaulis sp.]